jgi:hypothetical protein
MFLPPIWASGTIAHPEQELSLELRGGPHVQYFYYFALSRSTLALNN